MDEEQYIYEKSHDMEEEYYLDWLTDNKELLREEFVMDNEDSFHEYCKERFNTRNRDE